jgi:hypothetical protein
MSNNKQSSVEWLAEQIKNDINLRLRGFDIDKALEQAKAMHEEEHGQTWADSIWNLQECRMNEDRAHDDFADYYEETFGGNK